MARGPYDRPLCLVLQSAAPDDRLLCLVFANFVPDNLSLYHFCKLSKQTTILFASFCKSRMCGLKMLTWITSIILLTPAPGLICNIWTSPFKDLNETFPSCKRGLTQTAGKIIIIRFKLISSAVAVITRRSTKSDLKKNSVPSQVEAQVRE